MYCWPHTVTVSFSSHTWVHSCNQIPYPKRASEDFLQGQLKHSSLFKIPKIQTNASIQKNQQTCLKIRQKSNNSFLSPTGYSTKQIGLFHRKKKKKRNGKEINFLADHTRETYPTMQSVEGSQLSNSLLQLPSVGQLMVLWEILEGRSSGQMATLIFPNQGQLDPKDPRQQGSWLESPKFVTQTKPILLAP